MDRRHQQVARQRDAHSHRRRLLVADFPEQDARDILAQHGAQPRDERHARLRVDLHLIDARQHALDGVLERHEIARLRVELRQRRVERRRLARIHRPAEHDHARRPVDQRPEAGRVLLREAELIEREQLLRDIHQAHDDDLAGRCRQRRDADVDAPAFCLEQDVAVLRLLVHGDVHARHDLEARNHRRAEIRRHRHDLAQETVDAEAQPDPHLLRLQMHIARMHGHRPPEHEVDELDDAPLLRPQPIAHLPHRLPHEILPKQFWCLQCNPPFSFSILFSMTTSTRYEKILSILNKKLPANARTQKAAHQMAGRPSFMISALLCHHGTNRRVLSVSPTACVTSSRLTTH